ncbi:MAG: carboxylating nicotinate-nucleotide diphosphorylase [Alphaproteobacteria bacterium]|nr:carboxylating nicotinate-nucleotide diphosphorylase [Alphaproteobacteria bacterium]
MQLDEQEIEDFIDRALEEDIGRGDLTTNVTIPKDAVFRAAMVAREEIVVCGIDIALRCFEMMVPDLESDVLVDDGERVAKGTVLARVSGNARAILAAERTALNILQHLSGISTEVRKYVDAVEGTGATMIDTRKTIPTLRNVAKYASFIGGARNHRIRLDDGVLIKDNHIAAVGSLTATVKAAQRATPALTVIEVECDTLDQVKEAAESGVDMILLDNMDTAMMREAVEIVAKRCRIECSGGVRLDTVREKAETGVDFISSGRMTQSAAAVDIGLDFLD